MNNERVQVSTRVNQFRKKLENDLAPDSSAEIPPESYTQIAYLPIRNSLIMSNKPIKATA